MDWQQFASSSQPMLRVSLATVSHPRRWQLTLPPYGSTRRASNTAMTYGSSFGMAPGASCGRCTASERSGNSRDDTCHYERRTLSLAVAGGHRVKSCQHACCRFATTPVDTWHWHLRMGSTLSICVNSTCACIQARLGQDPLRVSTRLATEYTYTTHP